MQCWGIRASSGTPGQWFFKAGEPVCYSICALGGRGLLQGTGIGRCLGWGPKGLPGSHDLKNLCTMYWPNRTTPRIVITITMGLLRRFRTATYQEKRDGLWSGWTSPNSRGMSPPQTLTQPPLCAIHLAI